MTQLLSPRVSYIERDESSFVSSTGAATAFTIVDVAKGAVNDPVFMFERNALLATYGKPVMSNHSVLSALAVMQGTPIWVTRVAGSGTQFASSLLQPLVLAMSVASGTVVTPAVGNTPATYSAAQLSVQGSMNDGSTVDVTSMAGVSYTSDNLAVATVSAAGVITGVSDGNAKITVTYNGASASIYVAIEI